MSTSLKCSDIAWKRCQKSKTHQLWRQTGKGARSFKTVHYHPPIIQKRWKKPSKKRLWSLGSSKWSCRRSHWSLSEDGSAWPCRIKKNWVCGEHPKSRSPLKKTTIGWLVCSFPNKKNVRFIRFWPTATYLSCKKRCFWQIGFSYSKTHQPPRSSKINFSYLKAKYVRTSWKGAYVIAGFKAKKQNHQNNKQFEQILPESSWKKLNRPEKRSWITSLLLLLISTP